MIRANFTMKLNDLDSLFIDKLKAMFKDNHFIEISILDEKDETEFLPSTHADREPVFKYRDELKQHEVIFITPQKPAGSIF